MQEETWMQTCVIRQHPVIRKKLMVFCFLNETPACYVKSAGVYYAINFGLLYVHLPISLKGTFLYVVRNIL
ncbi:hypothetical protein SAMN04487909_102269 [Aneurinibacillus migulanus]|uniref:Uncharacterized protein n=1 Tax=Aneurinibacillus migulanus TaxID=47500 RepID=A0A1G8J2S3_ANEMI|nr:hypothetical protein SAMN04487909_102269 [Aneurinibacillus migulanus]